MSRRRWRAVMQVILFGLASSLVYLGFKGWVMNRTVPAQYIGYALLAFLLAGLCGVNVWYGGPLDPRNDPPPEPDRAEESKGL